ncbi:hypothetical protein CRG98_011713 [Punica granatum]|uniref:Uncharacterized protein n=1 Tax=Punica granatum TaxID=22663 RepID=A0A2I0KHW3_PUNGR|nr:hypothetical protein CRG98_011713 [Punica granatum]
MPHIGATSHLSDVVSSLRGGGKDAGSHHPHPRAPSNFEAGRGIKRVSGGVGEELCPLPQLPPTGLSLPI